MKTLGVCFERPVPYEEALALQEKLVARRRAGEIPDTVLFLEHPPVVTLGVRARDANLLATPAALAQRGIQLARTPRGGDITYHAPGQLIMYPIFRLTGDDADVKAFVGRLEETAIRTAAAYGVTAGRNPGKTGAWTRQGKLAAIGVRFQKWVSSHGMSFNVNMDLAGFDLIVPCGLKGDKVTSLKAILGDRCPTVVQARDTMIREFEAVMGCRIERTEAPPLPITIPASGKARGE